MATRTILFRGQTRRKGERTSISGIPLPGIWVAGGAFLKNEVPSTIWCHPQNGCLLSFRGIAGDDQIAQWDTRYGETAGKSNVNCEER